MSSEGFSSASALAGLKDFQRRTAEFVFHRLYGEDPTLRFLVADEVGLGKTLVARGIIAKTLEFLYGTIDRIDVVYICSNATIASQNIKRLNVAGLEEFAKATRLTYLPREIHAMKKNKVNFVSFTPGTAFDHQRSRGGHADERAILYRILSDLPLGEDVGRRSFRTGLLNLLQATIRNKENWRAKARNSAEVLDRDLSVAFRKAVETDSELFESLKCGCARFSRYRRLGGIPPEDNELRYDLIGRLRSKLASVCLHALEPDLVILDEFQRFKHLLEGDDDAAVLAKALFEYPGVRVLLLSATPYKAFTMDYESDSEDHYPDFVKTLRFLFDDEDKVGQVRSLLSDHRNALNAHATGLPMRSETKAKLERLFLTVMCRTERINTTHDHNSMLKDIVRQAPLTPADIKHAADIDAVARALDAGEQIEYWKSLPYLLNYLKGYEFRNRLDSVSQAPSEQLCTVLSRANRWSLKRDSFEEYRELDPANPRVRALFQDTIDNGMWQLLWMPPSLPYIEPGGMYHGKEGVTKSLVFSSWRAVPDAIASICSYEAERRMVSGYKPASTYDWQASRLLDFKESRGRLSGMPVVAWLFPSPTLADLIDPLHIAVQHGGGSMSQREMRDEVMKICRSLVETLPSGQHSSRVDERWYWAAPVLLDSQYDEVLEWCSSESGWRSSTTDQETGNRFQDHLDFLVKMAEGHFALGRKPDDLAEVLCELSLAAPGVCSLRALRRIGKEIAATDPVLLSSAALIASGFRSLFNQPEAIAMLRGTGEESYWRTTLQYGIDGNLQAVLDEYVHVLRESLGLQDHSQDEQVTEIAKRIQSVVSLRPAQVRIDDIRESDSGFEFGGFNVRSRFALRFGDVRDDNNQSLIRADSVRDAFNSPFRPFVLASTSIGQEGLDFHTWCHAVVHWNLPSNPVDLEQREGRVHRYKGHAVRKNIAEHFGIASLVDSGFNGDPWTALFDMAKAMRANGQNDLIPYWVFESGSARVERRIPMIPYSRETGKLNRLKQGLALYRLVFGQPRQEDLLAHLARADLDQAPDSGAWLLSLAPPELSMDSHSKIGTNASNLDE